jgi:hypothetical protein
MSNKTTEKRKQLGLCIDCGKVKNTETQRCETCMIRKNNRTQQLRTERKDAGLCRCGRSLVADAKSCELCQEEARTTYAEIKAKAILFYSNICQCCGESDINKLLLFSMNEQLINTINLYRQILTKKSTENLKVLCIKCNKFPFNFLKDSCPHQTIILSTTSHEKWKMLGLCIGCGFALLPKDRSVCDTCVDKTSRHQEFLFESNLCIGCGTLREDLEKTKCNKCLQKNNNQQKNLRKDRIAGPLHTM